MFYFVEKKSSYFLGTKIKNYSALDICECNIVRRYWFSKFNESSLWKNPVQYVDSATTC